MASRRRFFDRSAVLVAREVLGWELSVGECAVIITETEAYTADDPASHSFRGQTVRNSSMFAAPGTAYVYLSYGMHWCANVACGPNGVGEAVLLRGGVAVGGADRMRERRPKARTSSDLSIGPGRLTQALGISRSLDGCDLVADEGPLTLRPRYFAPDDVVKTTTRIGLSKAIERPWRFVVPMPADALVPIRIDPRTGAAVRRGQSGNVRR